MDHNLPDFSGKILVVMYGPRDDDIAYVEKARLDMQGERMFITGTCFPGIVPGMDGTSIAIAWDSVKTYLIYDSPESLRDAVKKWTRKNTS